MATGIIFTTLSMDKISQVAQIVEIKQTIDLQETTEKNLMSQLLLMLIINST